jgi:hypothetical protein
MKFVQFHKFSSLSHLALELFTFYIGLLRLCCPHVLFLQPHRKGGGRRKFLENEEKTLDEARPTGRSCLHLYVLENVHACCVIASHSATKPILAVFLNSFIGTSGDFRDRSLVDIKNPTAEGVCGVGRECPSLPLSLSLQRFVQGGDGVGGERLRTKPFTLNWGCVCVGGEGSEQSLFTFNHFESGQKRNS